VTTSFDMMQTVVPSAGASAQARPPIFMPPPARFSMTIGWPQRLLSSSLTVRMKVSLIPPAADEAITRIGFVG
jgi:hypothetical protein